MRWHAHSQGELNREVDSASISGLGPLFDLERQLVIVAKKTLDDLPHLVLGSQVSWVKGARLFKVFGESTVVIGVTVESWGPFNHFVVI